MLRYLPQADEPNLLSSFANRDDAAVYRLGSDLALVQSIDYITPVVDDPYAYGAVAAANALSDLYAMGARPILALNLVGFPIKSLPASLLGEILRGGADKVIEAGAVLAGGHSIDDHEPKYGLAVTGLIHPERIVRNSGARPGDALVLTKPLGVGIITTGIDRGWVTGATIDRVVEVMMTLNRGAAEAMLEVGVHAATDVSGFGLMGHLHEMLVASGASARVRLARVPVLDAAWDLVARECVPDGSYNNYRYLRDYVAWGDGIPIEAQLVLCDAQTSGGLLIAVPPGRADELVAALHERGTPAADIIGEITGDEQAGRIVVAA